MKNIAKALEDLQKALDSNPIVKSVRITIVLQKPKTTKAAKPSKPTKN